MSHSATIPAKAVKKILIIEDEGEMCLVLNLILNSEEMQLDHVNTLQKAKDYLQKENPSVIILDNKLPDGFGVDFIHYLRDHYPATRIVMISGYDVSVQDVAMENGADAFLQKPFKKEELYQSIIGA